MSGHTVVHHPPGFAFKSHRASAYVASVHDRRVERARESVVAFLFEGRRREWVSEDEAKHGRRRTLIDDNPTSG